jgi:GDP-L-fucose synthase
MSDLHADPKIYVAGNRDMVGKAIVSALEEGGYINLVNRAHNEFDLTDQYAVRELFLTKKQVQI